MAAIGPQKGMFMKNVLKWAAIILGILIVLVLVASPFLLRFGFARTALNIDPHGWNGMIPGRGFPGPRMMGGFGFFGGMGMMFFRFLGQILLLGLIVAGVIALVRVFSTPHPAALPAAYVNTSVAAPAAAPVPAPVQTSPCKACGKELQPDWTYCPFCGEKV